MAITEEVCAKVISKLDDIRASVQDKGVRAFPAWVFEVESCGSELAAAYKFGSTGLGYSGKLKEEVPALKQLRQAIIRLSGACSTAGFGLPPAAVYKVLSTAIDDLEEQIRQLKPAQADG